MSDEENEPSIDDVIRNVGESAFTKTSVYFIAAASPDALVKIGVAFNTSRRMKELQVGCPYELVLLGTFKGGYKLEKAIHNHFSDSRLRGEWFVITDDMDPLFKHPLFRPNVKRSARNGYNKVWDKCKPIIKRVGVGEYRVDDSLTGTHYGVFATEWLARAACNDISGQPLSVGIAKKYTQKRLLKGPNA